MRQKGFAPLIIVIILALVGIVSAYYLGSQGKSTDKNGEQPTSQPVTTGKLSIGSPKPSSTSNAISNWKTYNNTTYKYTLKYPSNWEIGAEGEADVTTFPAPVLNSPCNYESGQPCSQMFVETGTYDPANKFEPSFIINQADKVSNKVTTEVDGEEAQGFEYFQSNYGSNGRLLYVLVTNHKNTKFTFTYEESQKGKVFQTGEDWQNKNVFDQIISSFKFTQ